MSASPSHFSLEFLGRLAADRAAGTLLSLEEYLAAYPGHEDTVSEEYAKARDTWEAEGAGELREGARVARFSLVRELGRGGQAAVWLADDAELGRRVALKLVPRPLVGDGLSPRFLREARATAGLEHPHICVLYDSGIDEPFAWLAMQYVEGETLADHLAARAGGSSSRPATPDELERHLAWFEAVARALDAAHARGIVHRDVKPANLMIDAAGEPVVLDFGVALLEEEGPRLTRTGTTIGTPAFMAPEQLDSGSVPIGPGVDVWSVGAVLYEACTGQRPFEAATQAGLIRAVLDDEPVDPRRLSPHVSDDLAAVIETALSKELAGRYRTAAALADDLAHVRAGEPTMARPLGRMGRTVRWARRNPVLAGLSSALAILLVVATTVTLLQNQRLSDRNVELVDLTDKAEKSANRAQSEATAKGLALAEYERMADARRLKNLLDDAARLVPAHPDLVEPLTAWSDRATALVARLPLHRDALAALREAAEPYTEAQREADFAEELEDLRRLRAALPYVNAVGKQQIESEIAALEPRIEAQSAWRFGDDVESQFRHDALALLVANLEAFDAAEGGVRARVEERLSRSRVVQEETVERFATEWEATRERIAANELYATSAGPFELPIQVGLIPLGPDPVSTLEEFLVWETQRDAVPERDADGRFRVDERLGVVLVLIPPGPFWMGSQSADPDGHNFDPSADFYEGPVHEVELDAFFIGKYEVTQAQWLGVTGDEPSAYYRGYNSRVLTNPIDLRHPVEQVNWFDCQEVLGRIGLELPTEAQWECAARARGDLIYAGTSYDEDLHVVANIAGTETATVYVNYSEDHRDAFVVHAPVGSFEPNEYGLHDATGNVWEWCRDRFASYTVPAEPAHGERPGFLKTRMYRGGSSGNREPDQRVAKRTETNADLRFNGLGVRAARSVSR